MALMLENRFAVAANLPKISYLTKMDIFILGSTLMVFLSIVEVVITSHLARTEKRLIIARWIDRTMRVVFPAAFALICWQAYAW